MATASQIRRLRLYDRLGRNLIAAGGIGVIAAVLGIFVFIGRETYPLFLGAHTAEEPAVTVGDGRLLATGIDPNREVVYSLGSTGVHCIDRTGLQTDVDVVAPAPVTAAYRSPRDGRIVLGLDDGRAVTGQVTFESVYADDQRRIEPAVDIDPPKPLLDGDAVARITYRHDGDRHAALAAVSQGGQVVVRVEEQSRGLLGAGRVRAGRFDLTAQIGGQVTAVALDGAARQLAFGMADGRIQLWRLAGARDQPERLEVFDATPEGGAPVTALAFLLGDLSLAVGDGDGHVSTWFRVADGTGGEPGFRRIHVLQGHDAAVTAITPSERDKQFLTGAADGTVALHHATTEQTILTLAIGAAPVRDLAFAPKADGFLVLLDGAPQIVSYALDNPHPDVTLGTLFERVWYEGYDHPEYVWQSTGGTDEFEPKLSMVPLIFGTVKGTLYAMLFALPLGVLAALYTAEFASPKIRNAVKPTVEIMASLPSVILGFLAGLWLAPLLEHYIVGTALLLLLAPLVVLLGAYGWRRLPRDVRMHLPRNAEFYTLVVLSLVSAVVALWLGPPLERALFGGSLPRWLTSETSLRYDQRNCLVIGFAMGFAVIPLVFTICEDALSSVPASLKAASLGLGATRWQTAVRVVLPMALPGVFSAAMIGFGRAVGETMIVLMATGNTPVLDWNIFTGMRTISANIAVELPEAPHAGSLYRVLFFSGLLLFVVTFAVNTVAEGVRQRLRERYKRV